MNGATENSLLSSLSPFLSLFSIRRRSASPPPLARPAEFTLVPRVILGFLLSPTLPSFGRGNQRDTPLLVARPANFITTSPAAGQDTYHSNPPRMENERARAPLSPSRQSTRNSERTVSLNYFLLVRFLIPFPSRFRFRHERKRRASDAT